MIDVRGASNLQCAEHGLERGDPVVIEILSSDFELHRYGRRHCMILEGCRWVAQPLIANLGIQEWCQIFINLIISFGSMN
jgi:hypothetical protein